MLLDLDLRMLSKNMQFVKENLHGVASQPEILDQLLNAATMAAQMLDGVANQAQGNPPSNHSSASASSTSPTQPPLHTPTSIAPTLTSLGRISSPPKNGHPQWGDTHSGGERNGNAYTAQAQSYPHGVKRKNHDPEETNHHNQGSSYAHANSHPSPAAQTRSPPKSQQQTQQDATPMVGVMSTTTTTTSTTTTSSTPTGSTGHSTSGQQQTCLGCAATSTPEWRRGPMGPRTLCNACGLVYAKMIKKRDREKARAAGGTNANTGRPNSNTSTPKTKLHQQQQQKHSMHGDSSENDDELDDE
ncbi:hypothetical protein AAF712_006930 [Marasmius tenuissimus]|uniref:GATA-type domain-containing protein n=1 Tax=Marasmius tenuissimus TaxID=585030 RepID=A0ABR2ZXH6_9AGAR